MISFEWNEEKNRRNLAKHKVSFETAKLIFEDPRAVSMLERIGSRDLTGGAYSSGPGRRRIDANHFGA